MFRNWVTDPEASRFWGGKLHENIEETKLFLQGWINDYAKTDNYHWVIVIKELSEAIGYIYLNEIDNKEKSASIHYLNNGECGFQKIRFHIKAPSIWSRSDGQY